jgi:hypothetical protein
MKIQNNIILKTQSATGIQVLEYSADQYGLLIQVFFLNLVMIFGAIHSFVHCI